MFMLAKIGNLEILKSRDYIFEPKLDGTRAMAIKEDGEIKLINRRGYNIRRRYPELNIESSLDCNRCMVDGEIIVYNSQGLPDFHLLQSRDLVDSTTDIKIRAELYPATYVIFDILEKDSEDLRSMPLLKRKEILHRVVREGERIQIIPFTEDGEKLWEIVKKLNIEGVMAKKKDSPYKEGRHSYWLKIKYFKTVDAIIVGYTPGKGIRENTFGALLLALNSPRGLSFIGKVGTGFDDELSRYILSRVKKSNCPVVNPPEYKVVWVRPELVCEVQYLEVTKDLKLRAPSFKRLRFDKNPEDCTIENLDMPK